MSAKGKADPVERKGGLSCAECRRSKLKCDRVFPCQSCIRRNCAAICPDGTLAATKRNRVLMEHAQKLTDQVRFMSTRIHELEVALAQSQIGSGPHPLLESTEMKAEDLPDVESIWDAGLQDTSDAIGSLSIDSGGQALYHGETASSEYLKDFISLEEDDKWRDRSRADQNIPFEIVDLKNSFPLGLRDCPYTKLLFVQFLPTRARALQVADLYYTNVAWMFDPIVRDDFMNTIIDPIYGNTGVASLDLIHSHRLAVFFILLATGMLYDSVPSAEALAEEYHVLARAALSLDSLLLEATCATVQALFMMIRFIYTSDRTANEARWLLVGLCCRVAQTIGLQRDSANWNLQPDEVQRRRVMFWELFTYDAWTSVVNGRPTAFSIRHTDCHFPDDLDPVVKPSGELEWGWHAWKFRYAASCLSLSVQHIFLTKVPPYSAVLDIDTKIRKFPLSDHLQSPLQASNPNRAWSSDPAKAMQQYCAVAERESNLLYIHRSYFAQAIRQNSEDPLKHTYTPSVLATYRSACRLILSLKGLYAIYPAVTSRVWFFWSGIFSACIVLGALVVESPGCSLAQTALQELDQAVALYDQGSRPCRPQSSLPMLKKLLSQAYNSLTAFHAGVPPNAPNTSTRPDCIDVVLGARQTVINKSASNSPGSNCSSSSQQKRDRTVTSGEDGAEGYVDAGGTSMAYYDDLRNPGYDQGRSYEIPNAGYYPMQDGGQATGYMIAPSGERYPPEPSTSAQTRYDVYRGTSASVHPSLEQGRLPGAQAGSSYVQPHYTQQPSQPLPQAQPQSLPQSSLPRHLRQSRPQPPLQQTPSGPTMPQPHAGTYTTNPEQFAVYGQNQDEIWGNFVRHLGVS